MWSWQRSAGEDRLAADSRELGASLLGLEINTIIKAGITAERMPVLPHALLDMQIDFCQTLLSAGLPVAALAHYLEGRKYFVLPRSAALFGPPVADQTRVRPGSAGPEAVLPPEPPPPWPDEVPPPCTASEKWLQPLLVVDRDGRADEDAERLRRMRLGLRPNAPTFKAIRNAAQETRHRLAAALQGGDAIKPPLPPEWRKAHATARTEVARIIEACEVVEDIIGGQLDRTLLEHLDMRRDQLKQEVRVRRPFWRIPGALLRGRGLHTWRPRQLGPYLLAPTDYLKIRKVWEVGAEEVVAQTVVHMDGDVMTRIIPRLTTAAGRDTLAIHQQAVETSVAYWQGMVRAMLVFAEGVIGSLFRGRR